MPEPELNPDVSNNSPSATDGLLSILAGVGLFAVAAKGPKLALRHMSQAKREAGRQYIAKAALKQVQAIVKHPAFKTINKAFQATNMAPPGPLEQIVREIDVSQMGILQDLFMIAQTSAQDVKLRSTIAADIMTKYEREIPALARGRPQRLALEDLSAVVNGTKYQEHVDKIIGPDGRSLGVLASKMGISAERLGKMRIDPWLWMDPRGTKQIYNLSRLNPLRVFDKMEQISAGGIPLFRMRSDPRGNKLGTAMFGSQFEDGKETTNPILKLLSGNKKDKGDLMISGGVAWSRRSSRDTFELLEGPFHKKGEAKFALTSDQRQGQHFFLGHADKDLADEALYGVQGKPKTDWGKTKRFFGMDVGARGGYSRGGHGTILDDILREPLSAKEGARRWAVENDPTGFLGSVSKEELLANRVGDIGSRSPVAEAGGFSRIYVKSADPLVDASNWANNLVSRPLYLASKVGFNIRPGKTALGTLGKVSALATAAYMGVEGLKYADYALHDLPSKGLKYALGGAEYARQTVLGATGASEGVESLEEELPGVVTSPLSKALRMGGMLIGGALVGAKFGGPKWLNRAVKSATDPEAKGLARGVYGTLGRYIESVGAKNNMGSKAMGGLLLGTGAGGLMGLGTSWGDVTATPESVAERMKGDRKVPYRASAGWMLGRDPFAGGRIRYHAESRYNTFGTAYQDVGVYGSQGDKWKYGSWLPTLQNWGGARRLLNPYHAEDRNYSTRPYPATGGHFGDVPIFGPMLQGTIGSLLKPTRYRDPYGFSGGGPGGPGVTAGGGAGGRNIEGTGGGYGALSNMNTSAVMTADQAGGALAGSYSGTAGFRGYGAKQVERMGFGKTQTLPMHAAIPTSLGQTLGMQVRAIEEYIGLRGFQMQMIRNNLMGSAYPSLDRPVLASSGKMTSAARGYYDREPGGLLGMTELPRRFLLRPSRQPEVNFIPNSLPNFLPGTLSTFEQDRTWPIDFSRGDPYCLTADTLVEVKDDVFKRIADLTTDDVIRTHTGKEVHPKRIVKRKLRNKEKLYEIKVTSLSAFPIKASEDHPILSTNGWVEARDLKEGEYVGYPITPIEQQLECDTILDLAEYSSLPVTDDYIYISGDQEYADCVSYLEKHGTKFKRGDLKKLLDTTGWNRKKLENAQSAIRKDTLHRIPRYLDTSTKEWGLLVGYYLAEGSITKYNINFAFNVNETLFHTQVLNAFHVLFGLKGNVYAASKGKGADVIICNKALSEILTNLLGKGFDKKRLKLWKESWVCTLRSLFDGDGSFFFDQGKPCLSLKLKNHHMLVQVRYALLSQGFVGSIVEYNLIFRGQAAKDCALFLGVEKYKECEDSLYIKQHTFIKDGYVWMRVFKKTECEQEDVYGVEVDVDDSFCTVGVATHNTKIPQGEARLPGPGHQALHTLHGGSAYTMLDSFIILADVAPFSQAYRVTKQEVDRLVTDGKLDPMWIRKYQIAVEQAEGRAKFRVFHSKRYGGTQGVTVKKAISPTEFTTYEHGEQVFSMSGTDIQKRSDVALSAEFQRQGATGRQAKVQAAAVKAHMFSFLQEQEGRKLDISMLERKPGSTTVEASAYIEEARGMGVGGTTSNLREQSMLGRSYTASGKLLGEAGFAAGGIMGLIGAGKTNFGIAQKGSLVARIGGVVMGAISGGVMGGWAENKFTGDFSATEHYERFNKYGTSYADWSSPVDSFLRTWMHSAASTVGDYTPMYRQRQRDVEEYFDKLKYTKNKMLMSKGVSPTDTSATMTGLDYKKLAAKSPGLLRAIPNSERPYFQQFAAEMDPEEQQRIIEDVPDYMKSIYLSIWKNSKKGASLESPELDHAYSEFVMPLINTSADERTSQYFESHALPGVSSGFWHPSISADAVKYKTIEAMGGNPHTHGLYSTQGARINAFQPDIANIADDLAASFGSTADREDFSTMQKMLRGQDSSADLYAAPSFMFRSGRGRIDIMQDDRARYQEQYSRLSRGRGIW